MLCPDTATVHSLQQFGYVIGKFGADWQLVNDEQPVPTSESNAMSVHAQTPKHARVKKLRQSDGREGNGRMLGFFPPCQSYAVGFSAPL